MFFHSLKPADVICFTDAAIMKDSINRPGMIFHKQPVTHVFTFTVNRLQAYIVS